MAYLRLAVRGDDEQAVGRAFSGAVVETSLSSYPGTFFTSAPSGAQGVARYWPTTVAADVVTPHIECDGRTVPATPLVLFDHGAAHRARAAAERRRAPDAGAARRGGRPSWSRSGCWSVRVRGTRAAMPTSGSGPTTTRWRPGCSDEFSTALLQDLLPEVEPYPISRYPLPNLRAVNFVVHGILGWGVASNLRLDTQAKGLGELLRSRPSRCRRRWWRAGRPRRGSPRAERAPPGEPPGHLAG